MQPKEQPARVSDNSFLWLLVPSRTIKGGLIVENHRTRNLSDDYVAWKRKVLKHIRFVWVFHLSRQSHCKIARKHVELTANAKDATQAKDLTSGPRAILSAAGDRYGLHIDAVRSNAGAHDAGFRPAADVLYQPGQRVRLYTIQRD